MPVLVQSAQMSDTASLTTLTTTTCQPQPLIITVVKKALQLPAGWKQDAETKTKEMSPVPMAMGPMPMPYWSPYISPMSTVPGRTSGGVSPALAPITTKTEIWMLCVPELLAIINKEPPPQTAPEVDAAAYTAYKCRIMDAFHELRFHREVGFDVFHRGPCPRRPRHGPAIVIPTEERPQWAAAAATDDDACKGGCTGTTS